VFGTLFNLFLLAAIIYTIQKITQMWTAQNPECRKITCIAIVFGQAIVVRSLYEVTELCLYLKDPNRESLKKMMEI
jgi:hypothetical protein